VKYAEILVFSKLDGNAVLHNASCLSVQSVSRVQNATSSVVRGTHSRFSDVIALYWLLTTE